MCRAATLLALALALLLGPLPAGSRKTGRCRKGRTSCDSCVAIPGCAWCGATADSGEPSCLERSAHPTGSWRPQKKVSKVCDGMLQPSCLSDDSPLLDSDRVSQAIDRAVPSDKSSEASAFHGAKIADSVGLWEHMQRIVERTPGARFLSDDQTLPVVHFRDFLSASECAAVIAAGEPGLQASVGALVNDSSLEAKVHMGRSSHNTFCMGECAASETVRAIDARIANATGFSFRNMEPCAP